MSIYYKNMSGRRFGLAVVCCATILFGGGVSAKASDRDRIDRLEQEFQTLSRSVYRGEQPSLSNRPTSSRQQADAEIRVQQLEIELRNMRGKLEEQSHQMRQLQSKLERSMGDLTLRVQDLESAGHVSVSKLPMISGAQDNTVVNLNPALPRSTQSLNAQSVTKNLGTVSAAGRAAPFDQAALDYENAFAMLKASNFAGAEKAFDKFLKGYPAHALNPNARYWYGETFYVRGKYERSARIFAEAYLKDPRGSKAPDNLLKLGMSLAGLGNKDDACVALKQLSQKNISGSNPVLRRAEQEMSRLGC